MRTSNMLRWQYRLICWMTVGIVSFATGLGVGWFARAGLLEDNIQDQKTNLLLEAMSRAHGLFARTDNPVVEYEPGSFDEFAELGRSHLGVTLSKPAVTEGVEFSGARLLPISGSVSGMLVFERNGKPLSMLMLKKPADLPIRYGRQVRNNPSLFVTERDEYMIAFVGPSDMRSREAIMRSVLGNDRTNLGAKQGRSEHKSRSLVGGKRGLSDDAQLSR